MNRPIAAPALLRSEEAGSGASPALFFAWIVLILPLGCDRGPGAVGDVVVPAAVGLVSEVSGEGSGPAVARGSLGLAAADGAFDGALDGGAQDELSELPELLPVEVAAASFPIGPDGGRLAAGALALEIPPRALPETEVIEIGVVADADHLEHDLPPFAVLGAFRTGPWNPGFTRAVRIRTPLRRELERGTPLELLAWQPAMRAYLVIGFANVDASGRSAVFSVRQL